jgi:hypothetical protein
MSSESAPKMKDLPKKDVSNAKRETGRSEPYRVQFSSTVDNALNRLAIIESRSVPNLIRQLTVEALVRREIEKNIEDFINQLIREGGIYPLVKAGTR